MKKATSSDAIQHPPATLLTNSPPRRSRAEIAKTAKEAYEKSPRYLVLLDAINLGLPIDDRVRAIAESLEQYDGPSCLDGLLQNDTATAENSTPTSRMDLDVFLNPGARGGNGIHATVLPSEDLLELVDPDNKLSTSTFHLFMWLPKELRSAIWDIFIENVGPRNIHVTLKKPETGNKDPAASVFKTTSPVPEILTIYPEARTHGLTKYTTIFNTVDQCGDERREIYARPEVDTIIFHLPKWMKQCHTSASIFNMRLEYPAGLSSLDFSSTASLWSNGTHTMRKLSTYAWIDANSEYPCHDVTRNFLVIHPRSGEDWKADTIGVDTGIQSVQTVQVPACWDGFWTAFCHGLEIVSPATRCRDRCTGCVKQPWVSDYDSRFWED